jgi:hypothetical protein
LAPLKKCIPDPALAPVKSDVVIDDNIGTFGRGPSIRRASGGANVYVTPVAGVTIETEPEALREYWGV